jgi:hypothetical protein
MNSADNTFLGGGARRLMEGFSPSLAAAAAAAQSSGGSSSKRGSKLSTATHALN